jgi:hypothetical protein
VRDRQSFDAVTVPIGSSPSEANASADDEAGLLALEMEFNTIVAELRAAHGMKMCLETGSEPEARDHEVEVESIILARLYPVEQRIMQTPARTIAGLAVKARDAAYVMSQYWEVPIDRKHGIAMDNAEVGSAAEECQERRR